MQDQVDIKTMFHVLMKSDSFKIKKTTMLIRLL